MSTKQFLMISETFYSIQGEGPSAGTPAVFLRLSGCNLTCKGFSAGCDTEHIWKQGTKYTPQQIIAHWQNQGWLDKLKEGAHLVITGGEPTLQQSMLVTFIEYLDSHFQKNPYIEMETNATYILHEKLQHRLNQINASPKLSHNGDATYKTYRPDVIQQFSKLPITRFKFVIMKPEDIQEIIEKFVKPFDLNPHHIWLMPEGITDEILQEKSQWIVELCKKYMMNFSPRLHIHIWGETTGV